MGFDIANDSLQQTAFIIAVIGVALALLATVLRFVATKRAARKPNWEEWFAVLATFFYVAYVVPFLYILVIINGRNILKLAKDDIVKVTKAGYFMAAQFCMQQLFAKLSLLFLYYRLFYVNRSFVRCIYFLGIVQLLWSIATYVAHYLECTPPQKLWNPALPGHCLNAPAFLAAGETPNSLTDFAMVGLAIWMVQSLQMKTSVKVKLSVLFGLGGLAGILGFVKIGLGFTAMSSEKIELLDPIWAIIQQACSVICCCAPIYKPLLPEVGLLHRLRSFGSRTFGKSVKSGEHLQSNKAGASDSHLRKHSDHWVQLDEWGTREPSLSQLQSPAVVARREEV
ncbi:hypothetical protein OCU04_007248 [Sclerotinia nivalis]|uniref:Rhodopsin domain-containing protein n=1 Tax=Sclerotinia nivalis TaxID=352851 RepID=A0A9X0AMB9_9HELO|nr:hypothetical protein OCU04_007248 [Sclerotinia nivalis]